MTGSFETQVLNRTKERVLSVLHSELWYFEIGNITGKYVNDKI